MPSQEPPDPSASTGSSAPEESYHSRLAWGLGGWFLIFFMISKAFTRDYAAEAKGFLVASGRADAVDRVDPLPQPDRLQTISTRGMNATDAEETAAAPRSDEDQRSHLPAPAADGGATSGAAPVAINSKQLYEAMLLRHDILRKAAFYGPPAPSPCPKVYFAVTDAKGYGRTGNHFITFAHLLYFASRANRTLVVPIYMKSILAHFDTGNLRQVGCFATQLEIQQHLRASAGSHKQVAIGGAAPGPVSAGHGVMTHTKSLDFFDVDKMMEVAKVGHPLASTIDIMVTSPPPHHPTAPLPYLSTSSPSYRPTFLSPNRPPAFPSPPPHLLHLRTATCPSPPPASCSARSWSATRRGSSSPSGPRPAETTSSKGRGRGRWRAQGHTPPPSHMPLFTPPPPFPPPSPSAPPLGVA